MPGHTSPRRAPSTVPSPAQLPWVDARIHLVGSDFLHRYWAPFASFVDQPRDADFILCMNDYDPEGTRKIREAKRLGRPLAWWTIEDPNAFELFRPQAELADFVFTTDEACIPRYRRRLGHDRIFWLPLAAAPQFHYPLALEEGATDFVVSANWYPNQARRWAVETVVDPLLARGYTLTLYSYENFMWPEKYQAHWRGQTYYTTVAQQYRHGRIVLGLNNQRSGMDGRSRTVMTSMRTFEVLACGKPLLSAHSDAYERLGFVNGEHMVWVDTPAAALSWAERLLAGEGERIALSGRQYVLSQHTYGHRLAAIAERVLG